MNTTMNGKRIASVSWPPDADGRVQTLNSGEHGDLQLSATYHGDHDEFWIVRTQNGAEVSRFNPRFVDAIVWLVDSEETNRG